MSVRMDKNISSTFVLLPREPFHEWLEIARVLAEESEIKLDGWLVNEGIDGGYSQSPSLYVARLERTECGDRHLHIMDWSGKPIELPFRTTTNPHGYYVA